MKRNLLFLLLFSLVLSACTMPASEEKKLSHAAVIFTDDLGREVIVDQPKRVAALLGSFADVWYLAGGKVVAAADDAWEDFDLELPEDAVNLGMTKELSLEKLFAAEPDFVLASANTQINLEWMETLEAAGIPTAYFDVADFEDYLRMLEICTQITGQKDLYEKNGLAVREQIERTVDRSKQRLRDENAPKVLSLRVSAASVRAKNSRGNVLGEMLAALGCENIADSEDSLLEQLNLEYILTEDPDYIFVAPIGDDREEVLANMDRFIQDNPAWSSLSAVKEGRVHILDKSLFTLKPNDRWGDAYEQLEDLLEGFSE